MGNFIGKGAPIDLYHRNKKVVSVHTLMTTEDAVQHYRSVTGNQLKQKSCFGIDVLDSYHDLQEIRRREVETMIGSFSDVFHKVVNGDKQIFHDAIDCFK